MAWTSPRTWVAGEVVTAAELNTHVRDNLNYLHDNPVGSTWNHIKYTANFGAAPDAAFRYAVGVSLVCDPAGWNSNTGSCGFNIPMTGTYLVTLGMNPLNTQGGSCAVFLCTSAGAFYGNNGVGGTAHARFSVGGGSDPDGNLPAAGASGGARVLSIAAGGYKFGGFRSSGSGNFDIWGTFILIG